MQRSRMQGLGFRAEDLEVGLYVVHETCTFNFVVSTGLYSLLQNLTRMQIPIGLCITRLWLKRSYVQAHGSTPFYVAHLEVLIPNMQAKCSYSVGHLHSLPKCQTAKTVARTNSTCCS